MFGKQIIEMAIRNDQMDQIITIKNAVNKLKSSKFLSLMHSIDVLEIYSTNLPSTGEIMNAIAGITKAKAIILTEEYNEEAQKGSIFVFDGLTIVKASATKERK